MTDDASSTVTLLGYIVKFRDGVKEPPAAQLYFEDTETGVRRPRLLRVSMTKKGFLSIPASEDYAALRATRRT
jgi:hypothetical protein